MKEFLKGFFTIIGPVVAFVGILSLLSFGMKLIGLTFLIHFFICFAASFICFVGNGGAKFNGGVVAIALLANILVTVIEKVYS